MGLIKNYPIYYTAYKILYIFNSFIQILSLSTIKIICVRTLVKCLRCHCYRITLKCTQRTHAILHQSTYTHTILIARHTKSQKEKLSISKCTKFNFCSFLSTGHRLWNRSNHIRSTATDEMGLRSFNGILASSRLRCLFIFQFCRYGECVAWRMAATGLTFYARWTFESKNFFLLYFLLIL